MLNVEQGCCFAIISVIMCANRRNIRYSTVALLLLCCCCRNKCGHSFSQAKNKNTAGINFFFHVRHKRLRTQANH